MPSGITTSLNTRSRRPVFLNDLESSVPGFRGQDQVSQILQHAARRCPHGGVVFDNEDNSGTGLHVETVVGRLAGRASSERLRKTSIDVPFPGALFTVTNPPDSLGESVDLAQTEAGPFFRRPSS